MTCMNSLLSKQHTSTKRLIIQLNLMKTNLNGYKEVVSKKKHKNREEAPKSKVHPTYISLGSVSGLTLRSRSSCDDVDGSQFILFAACILFGMRVGMLASAPSSSISPGLKL